MVEQDPAFHRDEIMMNAIALVGQDKVKLMLNNARSIDNGGAFSADTMEAQDLAKIIIEIFEGAD